MLVDIVIDVTQKKIDCRIHWSVMIKLETYFIKIFCSFYILYNTWYHIFVILLTWASVEMWVCSYCQAVTSWIWWRSEVSLRGDDHLLPGVVCLQEWCHGEHLGHGQDCQTGSLLWLLPVVMSLHVYGLSSLPLQYLTWDICINSPAQR